MAYACTYWQYSEQWVIDYSAIQIIFIWLAMTYQRHPTKTLFFNRTPEPHGHCFTFFSHRFIRLPNINKFSSILTQAKFSRVTTHIASITTSTWFEYDQNNMINKRTRGGKNPCSTDTLDWRCIHVWLTHVDTFGHF